MHRRLRTRCAELDVTIQNYVVCMLEQALDVEAEDDREAPSEPQSKSDDRYPC